MPRRLVRIPKVTVKVPVNVGILESLARHGQVDRHLGRIQPRASNGRPANVKMNSSTAVFWYNKPMRRIVLSLAHTPMGILSTLQWTLVKPASRRRGSRRAAMVVLMPNF